MFSRVAKKNWLRNAFPVSGRILAETLDSRPWTRWWDSGADRIFLVGRLLGATLGRQPGPWGKTGTRNLELDLGHDHLHLGCHHPRVTICSVNLVILKIPHQRLRTQGPSPFFVECRNLKRCHIFCLIMINPAHLDKKYVRNKKGSK